jgi:hypothetical protein
VSGAVNAVYVSSVLGTRVAAESGGVLGRLRDLAVTSGDRIPRSRTC